MSNSNQEIDKFFSEMRKNDKHIKIPPFDRVYPRSNPVSRMLFLTIGAAACIACILGVSQVMDKPSTSTAQSDVLIIVSTEKERNTESLVEGIPTIDTWVAPTNSLIEDFKQ